MKLLHLNQALIYAILAQSGKAQWQDVPRLRWKGVVYHEISKGKRERFREEVASNGKGAKVWRNFI